MNGKAFSTIIIHYSQAHEPTAVVKLVREKIHTPANMLMVVHETLTSQKYVDPRKTISDPCGSYFVHTHQKKLIVRPLRFIIEHVFV